MYERSPITNEISTFRTNQSGNRNPNPINSQIPITLRQAFEWLVIIVAYLDDFPELYQGVLSGVIEGLTP